MGSYENDSYVRALVPGCGLPSVQHLGDVPAAEDRSGSSSGCSCASSASSRTDLEPVQNSRTYQRGHAASKKPQLAKVVEHKTSNAHTAAAIPKHKSPPKRRSTLSDSGVSTSSSEGMSEMPPVITRHKPLPQLMRGHQVPSRNGVSSRNNRRKLSRLAQRNRSQDQENTPNISGGHLDHTAKRIAATQTLTKDDRSSSVVNRLLPHTLNSSSSLTRPTRSLPDKISPKSVTGKPSLHKRRSSVGVLTPISHTGRVVDYTRRTRSGLSSGEAVMAAKSSSRQPAARYGDFILTFPFNEATRKCALGNLDTKLVVRECQHRLVKVQNNQSDADLQLWGSLKPREGSTGQ